MDSRIYDRSLVTIPMYWAVKSDYLPHERQNILAELDKLASHKLRMGNQLRTLIVREENARIIAGLKEIHPDVRKVGVGGTLSSLKSAVDLKPLHVRTQKLSDEISPLQRETDLSITSLKDIEQRMREIKTYWRGGLLQFLLLGLCPANLACVKIHLPIYIVCTRTLTSRRRRLRQLLMASSSKPVRTSDRVGLLTFTIRTA